MCFIRNDDFVHKTSRIQANLKSIKLPFLQNSHGFSIIEVFITVGIILILVHSSIQILGQSFIETQKSTKIFKIASIIDDWNARQVYIFRLQKNDSGNYEDDLKINRESGKLHSYIEIF